MPKYSKPGLRADQRKAALAKIHIGKKQLVDSGLMDEDSYRDMLNAYGNVKSSKELTDDGIERVLAHLRRCGAVFKNVKKAGKKPNTQRATPASSAGSREVQLKKIEALLTDMGLPWGYLIDRQTGKDNKTLSMLERLTGVQRLEWCNGAQLNKVIAALAIHQGRQAKGA